MYKDKAYRILEEDAKKGKLSHAYLVICQDENLSVYLKGYAKLLLCDEKKACGKCRSCSLIDKEILPDCKCLFKKQILVDDIDAIISDAYFKPLEKNKKVYLISDFSSANEKSQNKLLKTLEEPPENVIFLLAGFSEYKILPTIKSRAKKIEITPMDESQILEALKEECPDIRRLTTASSLSGGYIEKTKILYGEGDNERESVNEILFSMKASKNIPYYSKSITKDNVAKITALVKLAFSDIGKYHNGQDNFYFFGRNEKDKIEVLASEYPIGAVIEIIEKLENYERALFFNTNCSMIADDLLYSLLEVKYKWRKL